MAFVYWIHLPEHTDITAQGYVGITGGTVAKRFCAHKSYAKTADYVICRAIRKYGDVLIVSTLVDADITYCKIVEAKLRPTAHLAWNSAVGGLSGTPHTIESKLKMSEVQKLATSKVEVREARSARMMGNKLSEESLTKMRDSLAKRRSWERSRSDSSFWILANDFYDFWISNNKPKKNAMSERFGLAGSKFLVILKKFNKELWIPNKDPEWVTWYSNQNKGNIQ